MDEKYATEFAPHMIDKVITITVTDDLGKKLYNTVARLQGYEVYEEETFYFIKGPDRAVPIGRSKGFTLAVEVHEFL